MLSHVTRTNLRRRILGGATANTFLPSIRASNHSLRSLSSMDKSILQQCDDHHPHSLPLHLAPPSPFLFQFQFQHKNQHPHWFSRSAILPSSHLGSIRYMGGRRDGNKSFYKARKPSRKQQKAHTKRKQLQYQQRIGKHSAPGTKLRAKRHQEDTEIHLGLDRAKGITNRYLPDQGDFHGDLEYNDGDAMLDDLMGNTSHLTSTPTPRPTRLDKYYSKNYHRVKRIMENYYRQKRIAEDTAVDMVGVALPTDTELSQLIRSYRDKYGSRKYPIGIAKVLQLLLVELRIPSSLFQEKSYTSLMTCASHPKEAQRIMQLMDDHNVKQTSYVYSILVDLYAKKGDFRKARQTIDQMSSHHQIPPTLPAYTSLLAACFKVVNRGNAPHKLKAEAAKVGWESWKEMRIIGLEADVMAYGGILRLCAARGHAEQCLSLIDEMEQFRVLPTTLIFTSALRGIAKAHENALRFEGGYSPKHKRREMICSYYGNLTREVLLKAENAEVEHDNGFVAALMLCAAAAGDAATAKAIYLASEVRNMTYLRTIGSDEHLRGMMVEPSSHHPPHSQLSDGSNHKISSSDIQSLRQKKSLERDHGKDSRIQSALLMAYANSMKQKGLGNIWQGRDNKGYLCEVSLKNIKKRKEPRYHDNSIPGMTSMEVGLGSMTYVAEDPERMSKKLRRKKFEGLDQDPNVGNTLDELGDDLFRMYQNVPNDLDGVDPDGYNFHSQIAQSSDSHGLLGEMESFPALLDGSNKESANFDKVESTETFEEHESVEYDPSQGTTSGSTLNQFKEDEVADDDKYDHGEPSNLEKTLSKLTNEEYMEEYHGNVTDLLTEDFEEFYQKVLEEIAVSGEEESPSEDEVRELYEFMKMEREATATALQNNDEEQMKIVAKGYEAVEQSLNDLEKNKKESQTSVESFASELQDMSEEYSAQRFENSVSDVDSNKTKQDMNWEAKLQEHNPHDKSHFMEEERQGTAIASKILNGDESMFEIEQNEVAEYSQQRMLEKIQQPLSNNALAFHDDNEPKDELDFFLEGLPQSRIKNIRKTFSSTLGNPSLLRLVPILRENLPDKITRKWLRETNVRHAKYVLAQLEEERSVDIHIFNGVLQVQTSAANIDDALQFYDMAKEEYGLTQNQYSDRLIMDMLVKNKEIDRAIQFKEKVESQGRNLDILSYGLLMEYYANRDQLEPALSLLKETISIHKYPPGERSLSKIRIICRQRDIEKEVGLVAMIGEDPVKWFKHGEKNLKREYSKKGNRFVNEGRNIFTRI